MSMELYSRDARWEALRVSAATSVADNYSKMGSAVGSDAAEASSTSTNIIATAHAVQVGDQIIFTSGSLDGEAREVSAVDTNDFDVSTAFSGAPNATDTFAIIRPIQFESMGGGNPVRILSLKSSLDQAVYISFDGSTDHLIVEGNDDLQFDLKSNNLHLGQTDGGYIYVKAGSSAPTSGSIWVMGAK